MGAAPSAELLRRAPFRSACYGGSRVLSLIPLTPEFFPSPDSLLFVQLYESRFDPYVRYYTRSITTSDMRLDSVPPAEYSVEEYYEKCMGPAKMCRQYKTNEELCKDYTSEFSPNNILCPIPCAVAFQYENQPNFPEDSVAVGDAFVKIIGGVGCTLKTTDCGSENAVYELTIFLRKSAGDHNMVRAMMCAACLFYQHCIYECKLSSVPMLPVIFHTLKTNVPFLCFLREIRNRVGFVSGDTDQHCVWVDGDFIRGYISSGNAEKLCEAFVKQTYSFVENNSSLKQTEVSLDLAKQTCSVLGNSDVTNAPETGETVSVFSPVTKCCIQKQFFVLTGFIDKHTVNIPAFVRDVSEVYIACVDALVRVVDIKEENGEKGGIDTEDDDGVSCVEKLNVRHGDILRFVPAEKELHQITPSSKEEEGAVDVIGDPDANTTSDVENSATKSKIIYGTWRVDHDIYLENVLLSFLHDECKNAREASADDPHWVRKEDTGEPVVEGNFHIWHFKHKGITYYYGTVPKFANDYRKQRNAKKLMMSFQKVSTCDVAKDVEGTSLCVSATGSASSKALTMAVASLVTNTTVKSPQRKTTPAGRTGVTGRSALQADRRSGRNMKMNQNDGPLHEGPNVSMQSPLVVNDGGNTSSPFMSYPLSPVVVPPQPCYTNGSQLIFVSPQSVYSPSYSSPLSVVSGGFMHRAPLVYEQGVGSINYNTYGPIDLVQMPCSQFVQQMPTMQAAQCIPCMESTVQHQHHRQQQQQQQLNYHHHHHHHHHHNHHHNHHHHTHYHHHHHSHQDQNQQHLQQFHQKQQMPVMYAPVDFAQNYSPTQQGQLFFVMPMEAQQHVVPHV